jgi:hypothetical protein
MQVLEQWWGKLMIFASLLTFALLGGGFFMVLLVCMVVPGIFLLYNMR